MTKNQGQELRPESSSDQKLRPKLNYKLRPKSKVKNSSLTFFWGTFFYIANNIHKLDGIVLMADEVK